MRDLASLARVIQDECACTGVRHASRAISRLYDDLLRPSGIQASQLPVLVALARFGEAGARMSALAEVLGMDRTTLSRSLVPLEKQGLLRVARDPGDARARLVLLSPAGERALREAFPLWQRAQQKLRALLGGPGVTDLRRRLEEVVRAIQPDRRLR
jgi:DNA-binding MarR family transcriptional regulator